MAKNTFWESKLNEGLHKKRKVISRTVRRITPDESHTAQCGCALLTTYRLHLASLEKSSNKRCLRLPTLPSSWNFCPLRCNQGQKIYPPTSILF